MTSLSQQLETKKRLQTTPPSIDLDQLQHEAIESIVKLSLTSHESLFSKQLIPLNMTTMPRPLFDQLVAECDRFLIAMSDKWNRPEAKVILRWLKCKLNVQVYNHDGLLFSMLQYHSTDMFQSLFKIASRDDVVVMMSGNWGLFKKYFDFVVAATESGCGGLSFAVCVAVQAIRTLKSVDSNAVAVLSQCVEQGLQHDNYHLNLAACMMCCEWSCKQVFGTELIQHFGSLMLNIGNAGFFSLALMIDKCGVLPSGLVRLIVAEERDYSSVDMMKVFVGLLIDSVDDVDVLFRLYEGFCKIQESGVRVVQKIKGMEQSARVAEWLLSHGISCDVDSLTDDIVMRNSSFLLETNAQAWERCYNIMDISLLMTHVKSKEDFNYILKRADREHPIVYTYMMNKNIHSTSMDCSRPTTEQTAECLLRTHPEWLSHFKQLNCIPFFVATDLESDWLFTTHTVVSGSLLIEESTLPLAIERFKSLDEQGRCMILSKVRVDLIPYMLVNIGDHYALKLFELFIRSDLRYLTVDVMLRLILIESPQVDRICHQISTFTTGDNVLTIIANAILTRNVKSISALLLCHIVDHPLSQKLLLLIDPLPEAFEMVMNGKYHLIDYVSPLEWTEKFTIFVLENTHILTLFKVAKPFKSVELQMRLMSVNRRVLDYMDEAVMRYFEKRIDEMNENDNLIELNYLYTLVKNVSHKAVVPLLFKSAQLMWNNDSRFDYLKQQMLTIIMNQCDQATNYISCHIHVLIQLLRSTDHPLIHQLVLIILSKVATTDPDAVLSHIMTIFTFVGSSTIRVDDDYSFTVIANTIHTLVPIACRSSSVSHVVQVFLENQKYMPIHRKSRVFDALAMALDGHLDQLIVDIEGTEEIIVECFSNIPIETRVNAILKYLERNDKINLPLLSQLFAIDSSSPPVAVVKPLVRIVLSRFDQLGGLFEAVCGMVGMTEFVEMIDEIIEECLNKKRLEYNDEINGSESNESNESDSNSLLKISVQILLNRLTNSSHGWRKHHKELCYNKILVTTSKLIESQSIVSSALNIYIWLLGNINVPFSKPLVNNVLSVIEIVPCESLKVITLLFKIFGNQMLSYLPSVMPCLLRHVCMIESVLCFDQMLRSVPLFMSPYVSEFIGLLMNDIESEFESKSTSTATVKSVMVLVATTLEPRLFLPMLLSWNKKSCTLMMLLEHIKSLDKKQVASNYLPMFKLLLDTLSTHELDTTTTLCFIELVMKLNDTLFKPLFVSLIEWATEHRVQIFYRLLDAFMDHFKSLFCPYVVCAWDHLIVTLESEYYIHVVPPLTKYLSHEQVEIERATPLANLLINRLTLDNCATISECLCQLALSSDQQAWSKINHKLMTMTSNSLVTVRTAAWRCVLDLYERCGEDWLVLLPETVPFVAEGLEDEDDSVVAVVGLVVGVMEGLLGESLDKYFK